MRDPLCTLTGEMADRRATTAGEGRAARYLVDALRRSTHQVWVEPFRSFRSPRPAWVAILSLSLLGGMLVWSLPGVALSLTLLAALAFAAQALGWLELGWFFSCGESQNVIGVIPARQEIRRRVVVVAHYDTGPRLWRWASFLGLAAAVMALPPAVMAAVALPGHLWDGLLLLPLLGVAAGLATLLRGGCEGGNAAGVAAALAVGRRQRSLEHTELWTLFTGSRTPGLVGIRAFLLRHGRLLKEAQFIVLEQESGEGATLWQRRGEAAVLAEQGYRGVLLLTVQPGGLEGAVARIRTIAEQIDAAATESDLPCSGPDVVHYPHEQRADDKPPGPPGAAD
ncbi:MAG: hypothetical protein ACOY93_12190 [Bacillota bacterium]